MNARHRSRRFFTRAGFVTLSCAALPCADAQGVCSRWTGVQQGGNSIAAFDGPARSADAGTAAWKAPTATLPLVSPMPNEAPTSTASRCATAVHPAGVQCLLSILQAHPHGHAVDATRGLSALPGHVYWANAALASIGRADLDGSHVNPTFVNSVATGAIGLAVDHDYIYWSLPGGSASPGYIGRVRLDGSNLDATFITFGPGHQIYDVAVGNQHVYWTDGQTQSIGRANLDGSDVRPFLISTGAGSLPFGVATDAHHIYWSDQVRNAIGRADLNGSNPDPFFIHGGGNVIEGIEVDAHHVYWSDYYYASHSSSIGRADLDGSNRILGFIPNIPYAVTGVTLDDAHIYWANNSLNAIGRANLDGSNANSTFIPNAVSVYFLAVGRF